MIYLPYFLMITLMLLGLFITYQSNHLLKKAVGLNIFQIAIFMLYLLIAKVKDGHPPIIEHDAVGVIYTSPLPHVLMLTAIVVSLAVTCITYVLCIIINNQFLTLEEDELNSIQGE